jgi:hypothetical protein
VSPELRADSAESTDNAAPLCLKAFIGLFAASVLLHLLSLCHASTQTSNADADGNCAHSYRCTQESTDAAQRGTHRQMTPRQTQTAATKAEGSRAHNSRGVGTWTILEDRAAIAITCS